MFTAYLDASRGEGTDANVFSVAGFMSNDEEWDTFNVKWKGVLDHYDLDSFHMTDFEACRGQFEGWRRDDPRRTDLLRALANVIERYTIGSAAFSVSQAMYDAVVSEKATKLTGGPYFFLFLNLLLGMEQVMLKTPRVTIDWKARYILARGDQGLGQLVAPWMERGEASRKAREDVHMSDVVIAQTNIDIYPFQAADFIAFEARKQVSAQLGLHSRQPRRSLEMFEAKYTHPMAWHFYRTDQHLRLNAEIVERLADTLIPDD